MPLWKLEDSLHLGDIIKSHSYLGSVRVAFLFPGLVKVIKPKSFLFIEFMEKPVPFYIESVQWLDETSAILKFADVDSDEQAEALKGRKIFLSSKSIPKKIQDSWEEPSFEGFQVEDEEGNNLGTVIDIIESGPQSLLEVENEEKSFLIPIHEDIILEVIPEKKTIIVDLPEGLMEL